MPRSIKVGDPLRQLLLTLIGFRDPAYLAGLVRHINNIAVKKHADVIYSTSEPHHPLLDAMKGFIRVDTGIYLYVKPLREGIRLHKPFFVSSFDL